MSVTPSQVIIYGSVNMPEADGVVVGGAIDFTKRVMFSDLPYQGLTGSANTDQLDLVSGTSGDTGVHVQVVGRDSTGTPITSSIITTTGTTTLLSTFGGQLFQRLQAGCLSSGSIAGINLIGNGTAATSDVAVLSHIKVLTARTAQSAANTSGVTPPLITLQSGDGATVGATVYSGLGLIIRIKGGKGNNQLRMISAPYAAGTAGYGTDVVAVNRDWAAAGIPDATSIYDVFYGFLFDILPNPVTAITRIFATAAADTPGGAQRIFYEKIFWSNTNVTTSLLTAAMQVLSESATLPSGALLDLALTTTLNDTATAANRQTTPTGTAGFVTQPSAITVPASPFSLPAGNSAANAQGGWLRLTLPAGTTTYQGAADLRTTGSTT
jgi:hypothetical protein